MASSARPIAHVRQDPQTGFWCEHPLTEHLLGTACRAESFANAFSNGDWARIAAQWHDLGKFNPAWQSYLKSKSSYDPGAHLEGGPGKVDHSTAGALHAIETLGPVGRILAYLIAGHHASRTGVEFGPRRLRSLLQSLLHQGQQVRQEGYPRPPREVRRQGMFQFCATALAFCLIEEEDPQALVICYGPHRERLDCLVEELCHVGPNRDRMRAFQQFSVSPPTRLAQELVRQGDVGEIHLFGGGVPPQSWCLPSCAPNF